MKALITSFLLLTAFSGIKAQSMTKEGRTELLKQEIAKADWIFVAKDDDSSFYVDSLTMKRFGGSIVIFLVRREKKDSDVEYTKNIGGCTKHIMTTDSRMFSAPVDPSLKGGPIDNPEQLQLSKGMINYTILNFACKNSNELKLGN